MPARVQYSVDVLWQLKETFAILESSPKKSSTSKSEEESKEPVPPKMTQCGKKRSRKSKLEQLNQGVEPSTIKFDLDPQFTHNWFELLTFEIADAGKQGPYRIPKDLNDESKGFDDVEHIYSYNKVMGPECLHGIAKSLN